MKKIYRISTIVLILLSCLVVGAFYVWTTSEIEEIYINDTHQAIYEIKQDFIRDTVNNLLLRIESRRESETLKYQKTVDAFSTYFSELESTLDEDELVQAYAMHFFHRVTGGTWDAYLWDEEAGIIYFDPQNELSTVEQVMPALRDRLREYAVYTFIELKSFKGFFGVKQAVVDDMVKQAVADEIHAAKYAEDSYIWVNEIVNYDGGDNYAIRRIHPNLKHTEGIFLSTSMTDITGNFPYLEELNGVKMYGELFFTYNFKKLNSNEISEKLTFAKLYKPFDWVVAMGIHLDDMDALGSQANDKSRAVVSRTLPWFVGLLVLVVAFGSGFLILIERLRVKRTQRALESEANLDALTRVFNRRMGMNDLAKNFARFKKERQSSPAIIIFDIDDFKRINDTYGHTVGDKALQVIADTITGIVRSDDRLYRWGGDEFVLLCHGMNLQYIEMFGKKLLEAVRQIPTRRDDCRCGSLAISIGISFFNGKDSSHLEALERADQALYTAKRSGKDRFEILP